jgi:hypothetical protein
VVSSTFARAPLLAIILVFGLLVGLAGLFLRLNSIAFGEPRGPSAKAQASYMPMFAHLALVFAAGVYMPPALVAWFQNVAGAGLTDAVAGRHHLSPVRSPPQPARGAPRPMRRPVDGRLARLTALVLRQARRAERRFPPPWSVEETGA